jgi:SAM-dependent methyltransferase
VNIAFKDHFSQDSGNYGRCRPGYPPALFRYLASKTREHDGAWDCATGTGQAAVMLADLYSEVWATDASSEQIAKARQHARVKYKVAPAEASTLKDDSADLITVAQALHWFGIPAFTREVCRVLKPGGALAVWTYNLLHVSPDVDRVIMALYSDTLADYWPEERNMVESGYRDVDFPLKQVQTPSLPMEENWDLDHLNCYLSTWSAVRRYRQKQGRNPVAACQGELRASWGDPGESRLVTWPLTLKVWTNDP